VQQAKIQGTSQKIVQFGHVVSEMCERTDIQTDTLIAVMVRGYTPNRSLYLNHQSGRKQSRHPIVE